MLEDEWSNGIESELAFWRHWLETRGDRWLADYERRSDPNANVDDRLFRFLGSPRSVSVLDVGSGPLTVVGKMWAEVPIALSACDALGEFYASLPFPDGLPLVPVSTVKSEELSRHYAENTFDLVYARNTLDHGINPLTAVREMIDIAKPGGRVIAEHWPFEGSNEGWSGFHQWDLYVQGSEWMMRSRTDVCISITRSVEDRAKQLFISDASACFVVLQKISPVVPRL